MNPIDRSNRGRNEPLEDKSYSGLQGSVQEALSQSERSEILSAISRAESPTKAAALAAGLVKSGGVA